MCGDLTAMRWHDRIQVHRQVCGHDYQIGANIIDSLGQYVIEISDGDW